MLVHIIDDDAAVARTIARCASAAGWETASYGSADAFLLQQEHLQFGCVVSDISMPGKSGLELIEILHHKCPEWPVIMITGHADVTAAVRSFRLGAVHFLQKPFKRADLIDALFEAEQVGGKRRTAAERQKEVAVLDSLTAREKEVLRGLALGKQSKVIAWELGISVRTVEMHRSRILSKLGATNTSQAVALLQLAA